MNWLKEHLGEALGLLSVFSGVSAWLLRQHKRIGDSESRLGEQEEKFKELEKTVDAALLVLDHAREEHETRLALAEQKAEQTETQTQAILTKLDAIWNHLLNEKRQ